MSSNQLVRIQTVAPSTQSSLRARWRALSEPAALRRVVASALFRIFAYVVLIDLSFVFLFPILYMLATSLKDFYTLQDPTVHWLPPSPAWKNYAIAFVGIEYPIAFQDTLIMSLGPAVLQVLSCSLVGYGLARLRFRGRDVIFGLILFTFLVPPQTMVIGLFLLYHQLGLLNSYLAFLLPSALANGLKAPLFIIIFRQFFRGLPWELEEAARVDGAGTWTTYLRIVLPLAQPAIVVVFLFSFVWHWNDYWNPALFLNLKDLMPLSLRLQSLSGELQQLGDTPTEGLHAGIIMAASVLIIAPLLLVYAFTQRYLVESIDRTGLVE